MIGKGDVQQLIPQSLGHDVPGWMAQFFPGLGPDSVGRDYDDVAALALENVFNSPLEKREQLAGASRSAVFGDWQHAKEVRGVIAAVRGRVGA